MAPVPRVQRPHCLQKEVVDGGVIVEGPPVVQELDGEGGEPFVVLQLRKGLKVEKVLYRVGLGPAVPEVLLVGGGDLFLSQELLGVVKARG